MVYRKDKRPLNRLFSSIQQRLGLNTLRFQLTVSIMLVMLAAVMLMGLVLLNITRNIFVEEKSAQTYAVGSAVQEGLREITENNLHASAKRMGRELYHPQTFYSITFLDLNDRVLWSNLEMSQWGIFVNTLTHYRNRSLRRVQQEFVEHPLTGESLLVTHVPWMSHRRIVGWVQLTFPLFTERQQMLFSGRLVLVYAIGFSLLLAFFGTFVFNRMVVYPLEKLTQATRDLAMGHSVEPLVMDSYNELGRLAESFNIMAEQLTQREMELDRRIEAQVKINETLEVTRQGLIRSEKLASVGSLAAGVAHEVGNPLQAILGYVGILKDGGVDDALQQDILQRIENDISRIHEIISGLLSYSRSGTGKPSSVDLNEIIKETLEMIQLQQQFKNVEFDYQSILRPAMVRLVPGQLQQVLVNLFLNAAQAMDNEGQIQIFVEGVDYDPQLTFRQRGQRFKAGQQLVSLAVMDNGPGISEEIQGRLFDPFFTTKEVGQGTGLGLSVCDSIVDFFGGSIDVQSRPGEGSTFIILLPLDNELAAELDELSVELESVTLEPSDG